MTSIEKLAEVFEKSAQAASDANLAEITRIIRYYANRLPYAERVASLIDQGSMESVAEAVNFINQYHSAYVRILGKSRVDYLLGLQLDYFEKATE